MTKLRRTWIRWTTWEYLPMWLSNIPVVGFYCWYAARAGHPLFFSAANPVIPLGGALGESKFDILRRVPTRVLPRMAFIPEGAGLGTVHQKMAEAGLQFPLIAKPDVGERGFLVKRINSDEALQAHLSRYPVDFILQEYLDLPFEAAVLFVRFPGGDSRFEIRSVCIKAFLEVTGDGKNTLHDLILAQPRAAFQLPRLRDELGQGLQRIPLAGESVALGNIGNHCLGTQFLNGNHLIDARLEAVFEPICRQIDGIYFGRFDLRSRSLEAFRQGDFKVMELNGVFGEPAHVYDPTFGAWKAYRDFFRHWRSIFEVSKANRQNGVPVASLREGWDTWHRYSNYKRQWSK